MSTHLATYLNDHLAGSVAALDLLAHLERSHAGRPLGEFFNGLKAEIEADQAELEALIARLGVGQSGVKKAAAWVAEKLARLKLSVEGTDPLALLEGAEALAVGIHGKGSLWRALSAAENPALAGTNFERLAARADEQRGRVEVVRLAAAKAALGS